MTAERAREIVSSDPSKLNVEKEFGDYEGQALNLVNGRYGFYLKWGEKNCPIPSAERGDAKNMTVERARELASAAPEKKAKPRRSFSKKS